MNLEVIKGVLFDFGGCLDSDGIHSRELFFNCFEQVDALGALTWDEFQEGYTFSDQLMILNGLIEKADLQEMNRLMCHYICEKLSIPQDFVHSVSDQITRFQTNYLNRNRDVLYELSQNYKLGIISNFSGNLEVVLKEFSLDLYFDFVLDSYHVGDTKPSEKIFKVAVEKTQCRPSELIMVGDNPLRDIIPAGNLGMKTILIRSEKSRYIKSEDCHSADMIINSLLELPSMIQNKYPMVIQNISTKR